MTTPCHVLKAEIASASRTLATSKKLVSKGTAIDIAAQQSALGWAVSQENCRHLASP